MSAALATPTVTRWKALLPALLIATAFFAFLGSRGLNEPDEGRYAELGREMLISGDWLVPHLNGFPHFQKPPMLYWLTAASFGAFGVNEWAARLPSALAALGILALTAWMGRALFGRGAGWLAALVLASSIEFFVLARALTPDMLLSFWVAAAVACLVQTQRGKGRVWGWLFFAAMGLGFLTKGPMALVVPSCAALGLRFAAGRSEMRARLPWGWGLLLALAIGLSWFVAVSMRHPELFRYFAGDELLARFASKSHGRSKPFWFFLPTLVVGFLPWTFLFPAMARDVWRKLRARSPLTPAQGLLLGWALPPFLILSLSGSKLVTYILPLLPALALATAAWWQKRKLPARRVEIIATVALACCVAAASQVTRFNDRFAQQASVRPLAALLRAQPDLFAATIFACNVRAHGWEFYLGTLTSVTRGQADLVLPTTPAQEARLFESVEECERAMGQRPVAYGLVRSGDFARRFPVERWRVFGKAGDFLLIGRIPPQNAGSRPPQ